MRGINKGAIPLPANLGTEATKDIDGNSHVTDVGKILDLGHAIRDDRGKKDGKGGIF